MARISREHSLLIVLLAVVLIIQAGYTTATVDLIRHGDEKAAPPFSLQFATRTIGSGPYRFDQVEAIAGRPFTGQTQIDRALAGMRPGQSLQLTLRQPDGTIRAVTIPLRPAMPAGRSVASTLLMILLDFFVPLICLGLGFGVAAIRPRDPLAWLLLGLLISFSELAQDFRWDWPLKQAAAAWHSVTGGALWPIWMMLFGIYFPTASGIEKKAPWLKWLLIVPIVLLQLLITAVDILWSRNIAAAVVWLHLIKPLLPARMILGMIAVSWFFASLGEKSGRATSPDGRRRLGILYAGASVSLTPLFIIVLYALVRGRDIFDGVPAWVEIGTLLLLTVFPLTLAYVIVVHRALDVRVVVRQSVKYALARGGLWVLRAIVLIWAWFAVSNAVYNPNARRVDRVRAVGSAVALFFLQRRFAERLAGWIDRRFFREAYDAERVLGELSNKVRGFTETRPLLETVTQRISETLHVWGAAVLVKDGENYCLADSRGLAEGEAKCLPAAARTIQYLKETNRASEVYFDDPRSWVQETSKEERQRLQAMGARVLLPLAGHKELAGIMVLGPKRSEEPYSATDLQLLQLVAAQTGLALENSQLIAALAAEAAQRERQRREMEIAREVQERLFPQDHTPIEGVDYDGICRAALGVGGDYYDFLSLSNGKLGIAIGDVSGKGISAALLMASLQASLRGQALAELKDLSALMCNVNRLVYDASAANRYATFFYGEYAPVSRHLSYVNAGHNAPMILRGADVLRLEATGPVVGLLKGVTYEQAECHLDPGDLLLAFTDGITEAMTDSEEEWGEERLIDAARESREHGAAEIIRHILKAVDQFTRSAQQYDDMTLVVLKVL